MTFRLNDKTALQGVIGQMLQTHQYLQESGLEPALLELVSMRASQINGCAHCLSMHAKILREAGEREDRLAVLPAWRESTWFTDRERAALAWTEAVTALPNREVPNNVFAHARAQFDEKELADLTLAVTAVNAANRISIAFRYPPTPFTIDAPEPVATA
jgi:AhpD family alkylhydroperoxidase